MVDGGTIKGLIEGPLRRNEELLTMNDMRVGGRWDFIRCSFDLPNKLISLVKAIPNPLNHQGEDRMVWASSPLGEFEQKNAYGIARGDCEHSAAFKGNWIWKMDSMPKIKMFIWKYFLLSIPVGEVLQERGII